MTGFSIASFRHRVRLERPVTTTDGAGGETVAWEHVRSLWARVEPQTRHQGSQAGRRVNAQDYKITVRRWTDIEPGWRVIFEDRPLAIDGITELGERRLHLSLHCIAGLGE